MKNSIFFNQARLLLQMLPIVNQQKVFALKGGTAINFFIRDLPRLSVDIDLTYLPVGDREASFTDITEKMKAISETAQRSLGNTTISIRKLRGTQYISGMFIESDGVIIKIEPNTVIRGAVHEPQIMELSKRAQELFELSLKTLCLSPADLYGGKLCAALDRQHPRDLFDVKLLLENEGISEEIRKAFIVYLISHSRPIVEVLNPGLLDIESIYASEFAGMTEQEIPSGELLATRETLIRVIKKSLTNTEIEFLVSFKAKNPDWQLLGIDGVENLPAVKWKLLNLEQMSKSTHGAALSKLKKYLQS